MTLTFKCFLLLPKDIEEKKIGDVVKSIYKYICVYVCMFINRIQLILFLT